MDQESQFADLPRVLNRDAITLIHAPSQVKRSAVIIFHGMTGTPSEMSLLASHLYNKGFHVHVPCLTGHGTTVYDLRKVPSDSWLCDLKQALNRARELTPQGIFIIGLSFGALLALNAYYFEVPEVRGLVLAAPPLRFSSRFSFYRLSMLSCLPEPLLSKLGVVQKRRRKKNYLALPHSAYAEHSIGALSRLLKFRRAAIGILPKINVPLLVLQDPFDHHLQLTSSLELSDRLSTGPVSVHLLPGAEHEIFIGHRHGEACEVVSSFLLNLQEAHAA